MIAPKPSKEQQLLFNILKGEIPTSLEGIDTKVLFDLSQRHRLFPLAPALFPLFEEEERKRWKQAIQSRSLRALHLTTVLIQLTNAFKDANIEAIPLKGPLLSQLLYGSPGDRHSSDLDILVHDANRQGIIDIAGTMSFFLYSPKQGLSKRQWKYYSKHLKHYSLINSSQGVILELHTRIEDSLVLKPDEMNFFLKDMDTVEVWGQRLVSMNKQNTFLYLILHGGSHLYKRLFWLRDVSEALKKWDLNHQMLLSDAKSLGIERLLGLGLLLAKEFYGSKIPSEYCSFLEENKRKHMKLVKTSLRMILGDEKPRIIVNLRQHIFNFMIIPGVRYKIRSVGESLHYLYISKFLK